MSSPRPGRRELWALGGILLLAALARYSGLLQGFPRDFHWDERIYFHEAFYGLANGLRRESTVSANLPYLLMPGLLLQWLLGTLTGQFHRFGDLVRAYIADPAPFLLLGRATWATSGVLSVAATWRIGRRVGGAAIGLPAAFFLAGATKYYCAGVAPVLVLAHLLRPPAAAAEGHGRWTAHRPLLIALIAALGGALLTTPIAVIDPQNLIDSLTWELGARFGSIPTGDTPQWLFYLTEHLGNGLGPLLLGLGLLGGIVALTRRTPRGFLLVLTPVLFFVAVNLRPNNFARYIVPAIPFLCLTAAIALRTGVGTVLSPTLMRLRGLALDHPSRPLRALTGARVLRQVGPALLIVGALLAAGPSWLDVLRYDHYANAPDTRNLAQQWFEGYVPAGARVLVEGGESFERTSNLGPQLWPTARQLEARGPNEPRERFFWAELLEVVRAAPAYSLTLVGAFARTTKVVAGRTVPVDSVADYRRPDYIVLLNWRSDDLRPGSASPLWASLTAEYRLAQTFACRPCFPEDYYAWRMDYPTLAGIAPLGGPPLLGGPEVRVFQRLTTAFPPRAGGPAPSRP